MSDFPSRGQDRGILDMLKASPDRRSRRLSLLMAGAAALTLPENVLVDHGQGQSPASWLNVVIIAIVLASCASAGVDKRRWRVALLAPATIAAACFGLVTLTSIGVPMFLAAGLGVSALYQGRRPSSIQSL